MKWVAGRLTKVQKSRRPDHIWPEIWFDLSEKQRREEIAFWKVEGPRRENARRSLGKFTEIPDEELEDYKASLKRARKTYGLPPAPAMPVVPFACLASNGRPLAEHRPHEEHEGDVGFCSAEWYALVHTPIPMQKALKIPNAKDAVDNEWHKLGVTRKAWLVDTVQEKETVRQNAKTKGKTVHFGTLMDLCHEKHSELPPNMRSYKGRVVFRGDIVRDETGFYAVFSEQGTSASHLAAAKFLDAVARMPGMAGGDSDAVGAYTQVVLDDMEECENVETWISLPKDRRPDSWAKYDDPVCKLRLNLYGHPLAGLFWEKHNAKILKSEGFEPVVGWECLWVHKELQLYLSVYVDDYKMAGKAANVPLMWERLGLKLDLEPAVPLHDSVYLGMQQMDVEVPWDLVKQKRELLSNLGSKPGSAEVPKPAGGDSGRATQLGATLGRASDNADTPTPTRRGAEKGPRMDKDENGKDINAWKYMMTGHAEQCVERYCELANKTIDQLKLVATPSIDDHLLDPEDMTSQGELSHVAARIVLKALYMARLNRVDVLQAINILARNVTRWSKACDKRLHRLISYIHHHKDFVQANWVGDPPEDCKLALFVEASFADDLVDSKSTSGAYLVLIGPNTFVTLCWFCKKQGAVSHSSTEAEVIALEAATRMEGLPALMLWDNMLQVFSGKKTSDNAASKPDKAGGDPTRKRTVTQFLSNIDEVPKTVPEPCAKAILQLMEDNEAVIKMTIKGRSTKMRHVPRTHRVDLDWLFERIQKDPGVHIKYVNTFKQIADMLTKSSFSGEAWRRLLSHANIIPTSDLKEKKVNTEARGVAKATPVSTTTATPTATSDSVKSSHDEPFKGKPSKRQRKRGSVFLATVDDQEHSVQVEMKPTPSKLQAKAKKAGGDLGKANPSSPPPPYDLCGPSPTSPPASEAGGDLGKALSEFKPRVNLTMAEKLYGDKKYKMTGMSKLIDEGNLGRIDNVHRGSVFEAKTHLLKEARDQNEMQWKLQGSRFVDSVS